MKRNIIILLLVGSFSGLGAQVQIGNKSLITTGNTTFTTNTSLVNQGSLSFGNGASLYLTGTGSLSSNDKLDITNLHMLGTNYLVEGTVLCSESLQLKNGTLSPVPNAQLTAGKGTAVVAENQAHINGQLYHQGSGEKFYPIGKNGVYAPVTLKRVTGENDLLVGLEAFNQDLGVTEFPADVKGVSSNWYWQIDAPEGFGGSKIMLPVTNADAETLGATGVATVLQTDLNGSGTTDLGSDSSSDFFDIISELPAVGPYVLLGFESDLQPVIHNIITPKNDNKNPFLVIDHIDAIAENEVILLDRWGNQVFYEKNFTNYARHSYAGRVYDGAFDELPSGNYICLVKYQGVVKKQVITVLQ